MKTVQLGEIAWSAGERAGSTNHVSVYSVTKHGGFVLSDDYLKKQVYSRDISKYKLVKPGQFAYATIHLDEGSVGIAPSLALISPMYTVFDIDRERVDARYLLRFMKTPHVLAVYEPLGRGAVHRRKSISFSALGQLQVPLPSLEEQRRIAAILDHVDSLRAKRRDAIAHLESLPQAVFREMFGSAPDWGGQSATTTIRELASKISYGTSAKAGSDGRYPILRMGNLTDDGRLDTRELKYLDLPHEDIEKFTLREGDLLFNRTNSVEKVGKSAVFREEGVVAFAGYLVRVRFEDDSWADFVSAILNSSYGKSLRRSLAKAAVNQANINAREMGAISIPQPPINIVQDYSRRIGVISHKRQGLLEQLRALDELIASLQSRAFKGEL